MTPSQSEIPAELKDGRYEYLPLVELKDKEKINKSYKILFAVARKSWRKWSKKYYLYASIIILEATHFLKNGESWTKGKYKIIEIFDINDSKINFEWMKRRKWVSNYQ